MNEGERICVYVCACVSVRGSVCVRVCVSLSLWVRAQGECVFVFRPDPRSSLRPLAASLPARASPEAVRDADVRGESRDHDDEPSWIGLARPAMGDATAPAEGARAVAALRCAPCQANVHAELCRRSGARVHAHAHAHAQLPARGRNNNNCWPNVVQLSIADPVASAQGLRCKRGSHGRQFLPAVPSKLTLGRILASHR